MRIALLIIAASISLASAIPAQQADLYDEGTVRDLRLTFSQPNWWQDLYTNYATETLMPADLEVDGVVYSDVGVRFKGNSSGHVWPRDKMPFKIKTDEYVAGQDLYGYDNLNLHNSFMDPTFTREVVSYHVLREYMPAPKSNYVRLWLNGTYWGIYVNTEQVSGELLDEWFEEDDGNRYKCDPVDGAPPGMSTLTWLGTNLTSYQYYYQLKSDGDGNEWQDLVDMIDVLNNSAVSTHWSNLAGELDIDRSLWFLAANNLFCNLDSYIHSGHNYYVYNDPYEGRFVTIPWDLNEAFGNFGMNYTVTQLQRLSPLHNYGDSDYPLLTKLLDPSAGPRGRYAYLAHMRTMFEAQWDWSVIGTLVSQYQTLIEPDVIADTKKLYSLSDFYANVTQNVTIEGRRTACGLQPFVVNRKAYLLSNWFSDADPQFSSTTITPSDPAAGEDVLVTSYVTAAGTGISSVDLLYRTGAGILYTETSMYDDGAHGDGTAGDGVYGGWIPGAAGGVTVEYFLLAATAASTVAFDPESGEAAPNSYYVLPSSGGNGVVINEFLAKNDSDAQDETGEYEDWFELYNTTSGVVNLGGLYMTDDLTDLTKWEIPAGTTIDANDVLLFWADSDPGGGPLHAEFKLDADGEELALVDSDGSTLLDSIVFGPQEADISTGLLFDGVSPLVTFLDPGAGALNDPGSTGYRAYSALDSTVHGLSLSATVVPSVGATVTFELRDAPVGLPALLFGGETALYYPYASVVLLASPPFALLLIDLANGTGGADFDVNIPSDPAFVGARFYLQGASITSGVIDASNGLEIIIGP